MVTGQRETASAILPGRRPRTARDADAVVRALDAHPELHFAVFEIAEAKQPFLDRLTDVLAGRNDFEVAYRGRRYLAYRRRPPGHARPAPARRDRGNDGLTG